MAAVITAFRAFSSSQRLFILCAMLCGFLISAEYAIIRPVSNSVFLSTYGASFFPYAWMAAVPLNFAVVALYNKYLPHLGCFKMFVGIASLIGGMNLFCAFYLAEIPSLSFFFYVWKEVYIMLMFQQLWSVIHSAVSIDRAKYLYGILFASGGLGATAGSILPAFFAVKMGSESLLFASLPIYLLLLFVYRFALKQTPQGVAMRLEPEIKKTSLEAFFHGVKLIAQSRYLTFILCVVVLMQICSTLVDYQFNFVLERTLFDKDLRTECMGKVLGIVHSITVGLQLVGSFLLVHYLGVKRSHLLIPFLLCLSSVAFLFYPTFAVIAFGYISIKSCDFSLFGVIREMLYIPLKPDEKFRAKAIIDVFAHRSSKALASLLILALQVLFATRLSTILSWACVGLFVAWLLLVGLMFKQPTPLPANEGTR